MVVWFFLLILKNNGSPSEVEDIFGDTHHLIRKKQYQNSFFSYMWEHQFFSFAP